MHACTLKCIPMFVQSTFYGVCLLYKKKKEQLANVLMKEPGNICLCAVASSAAEVHPTLVQGPVSSHPNLEWQLRTDGPTQTPTGTQTHQEQDAKLGRGQSQQMSWSELACCVF